jgi:TonB-linked SusC/RagA family outer membrane protein
MEGIVMRSKLFIMSISILILLPFFAFGQQRATIKGVVTDKAGNPLPGANVFIQDTNYGAAANSKGEYSFSLAAELARGQEVPLIARFIGFKLASATITLSPGEITQNFMLAPDPIGLDEVVVVGYGTTRKEEFTGSIKVVKSEKLEQLPTSSFQDVLQGSPGLQVTAADGTPGGRVQIRIRGIGSISSSNEPLYVIDGVPVVSYVDELTDFDNSGASSNVLASLNPNDIETIVVLKDAASTAIYGSRGANGVILITTKGGVAGTRVQMAGPKVNLKIQRGYSDFAFDNLLKGLNADQYTTLFYEGYVNSGRATPEEAQKLYNTWYPNPANTNWIGDITHTGITNQVDLSAQGGTNNFNYYISAGLLDQEGVVIENYFTRYSSRANFAAQVTDRLHISNNLNLSYNKQRGITDGSAWEAPMYNGIFLSPLIPVRDEAGDWYYGHVDFFMSGANPVGSAYVDEREREQTRIMDNLSLTYQLPYAMKFQSTWSFDIINIDEIVYENANWGDGRSYGGRADEGRTDVINWQGINTLTYASMFAMSHNVEALVGTETQKVTTDWVNAYGGGFAHPTLHTLATAANPLSVYSARTANSFLSVFSRANYNYQGKYYVSASFRRDGSSRFGPEKRWGNFWSVGLGYTLTEEPFMKNLTFINYVKIRSSYGITGNAEIGNYPWAGLYGFTRDYDGKPGAAPTQIENSILTWESQENLNIGVDFSIWNNRISGTVDWFTRTSSDLLLDRPLSNTTGFRNVLQNVGDMKNTGIEFSLQGAILQVKNLELAVDFNITTLTNEITYLPEPYIDGTKRREEGRNFYEYYLHGWAGVDPANGDPLWYTDSTRTMTTNKIGNTERFYDGKSALPKAYGSFGLLGKKGPFSLSVQFNYQFGNYIYDEVARFYHSDGRYTPRSTSQYAFDNRWTTPGQEALFPQFRWGGNQGSNADVCDRYLFKGDYIRLKVLRIGYKLPQTFVSRIGIASLEAYIHLGNYWTWVADDQLYLDPEQGVNGLYSSITHMPKTSSIGFNIGL